MKCKVFLLCMMLCATTLISVAIPKDGKYYFNNIIIEKQNIIIDGTLTITKKKVTVSVGCNTLTTTLDFLSNADIKNSKLVTSTKKGCTKDQRKAEYWLQKILKSVSRYEQYGDRIDLFSEDFINLRLYNKPTAYKKPIKPKPVMELEEGIVLYTLKGYNWDGEIRQHQDGSIAMNLNGPKGKYTCNNLTHSSKESDIVYNVNCTIVSRNLGTLVYIKNTPCKNEASLVSGQEIIIEMAGGDKFTGCAIPYKNR